MKILVAFPMQDGQTGVYIRNGFQELGCEVHVVDSKVDYGSLVSEAHKFEPDMMFCSREIELLEVIDHFKAEHPNVKNVCYNVDARYSVTEWGGLLKLFNKMHIYYCKPRGNVAESQHHCPDTIVKYLPEGMDPTIHKREELIDEDYLKYGFDVVFAGSKSPIYQSPKGYGRIGMVEHIIQSGINLELISFNEHGLGKYLNEDHNKLCQCSKIVLGMCGWAEVDLANSARDFRVTAAGGFLLTEYVKGMEDFFELGKEVETYRTPQECVEKIHYYLEHEDVRKEIAEAGYQRTRKDHSFARRFEQVLEDVSSL